MAMPDVSAKVWLFYLKRSKGSLCTNVVREICSYFTSLQLPQVTAAFLSFFNCETAIWGVRVCLRRYIQADKSSRWVTLTDGQVFCCGGGNSQAGYSAKSSNYPATWKEAYLLGLDGTVTQLPNMLAARYCHGIIQVERIYVFGGSKF